MKQFFKYVFATVVGIIIVGVIMTVMSVVSLIGMASMSSVSEPVKDNSILVLNLSGTISERTEDNPFAELFGNSATQVAGLDNILKAIAHAKTEDKVKGIYIEAGSFIGAAPAGLQEIRDALVDFKKSGKFIMSYGDTYTQGAYYLASVADSIVINPKGLIDWKGMSLTTMFYKDCLDKLGVKMQVFKVGTYKSAVEPYILNDMSEANREQLTVFSSEIWNQMLTDVSKSRHISKEDLNALADSCMTFSPTPTYKKVKLVDKLAYSDCVPQILANMMDVDSKDDYHTVSINDLANIVKNEPNDPSGEAIAVYYAYGDIVDESASGFNQEHQIVGRTVIEDLKRLADDDDIKAVVLRVNSPGGSAYASEQIWHQVMNIKSKKPIIVSMGGYAASGGYYISCAADWIVAEPTTLTGSIGIFGMFPEASELLNEKLGIHFATVKTNQFADFGSSLAKPLNEAERAKMQSYINQGYELFTKRCADGRKMKQDDIKKIAEGRVWTGEHAKKIGLVDQLGSLQTAIAVAKKRANLDECVVKEYPGQSSIFDDLLNSTKGGSSYADAQLQQTLGTEAYMLFSNLRAVTHKTGVQASLPYYLMFNL